MKLNRKELTSALSLLSKIAERRPTLPILACVRIEAGGDQVQLTATDLEVGANICIRDEAPEPTTPFCLSLASFASIVKAQPKSVKEITLTPELEGNSATINGIKVDALSAEDFPSVTTSATKATPMPGFLAALGMVARAISQDENRYALNGVYLVPDKGVLVSTDGHRLHIGRIPPVKNLAAGILPKKAVAVILSAGKTVLEAIAITNATCTTTGTTPTFTAYLTNGVIVSRLVEGQFPNYEMILPKAEAMKTSVTVPTQTLREAVVTVSVVANDRNKPVQLAANGAITLSAESQELGQAEVALAGATYEGEPIKIGLNARYLGDVLSQVTSDTVTIQMQDKNAPILVNDGDFSAVVMPMRI